MASLAASATRPHPVPAATAAAPAAGPRERGRVQVPFATNSPPLHICRFAGMQIIKASHSLGNSRRSLALPSQLCSLPHSLGSSLVRFPWPSRLNAGRQTPFSPRLRVHASIADGRVERSSLGMFRAGQKRAEVAVPSLTLLLDSSQVVENDKAQSNLSLIDAAVAAGVTMVVIDAAEGQAGSAVRLFEAVCAVKAILRGRAPLLVRERADIAAAAGADGVLLSDQGLPAVAARRMMESTAGQEAAVLPLVGREVATADAAVRASAGDGADLLVLLPSSSGPDPAEGEGEGEEEVGGVSGEWRELTSRMRTTQVTIPVIIQVACQPGRTGSAHVQGQGVAQLGGVLKNVLAEGAAGVAVSFADVAASLQERTSVEARTAVKSILAPLLEQEQEQAREAQGMAEEDTPTVSDSSSREEIVEEVQRSEEGGGEEDGTQTQVEAELEKPVNGGVAEAKSSETSTHAAEEEEEVEDSAGAFESKQGGETQAEGQIGDGEDAANALAQETEIESDSSAEGDHSREGAASEAREQAQEQTAVERSTEPNSETEAAIAAATAAAAAAAAAAAEAAASPETASPPAAKPVVRPWTAVEVETEGEAALENEAKSIVAVERDLLSGFVDLLKTACPQMPEISLLEDSLARIADPFLVVIVGEFNSGKSSLINALLGGKFLRVGAVPTTNEITLIRHTDDLAPPSSPSSSPPSPSSSSSPSTLSLKAAAAAASPSRDELRHPDGHILKFLPADLLKKMNLVDTPGTNVILERQQRLTEEFVPQADLVLFVLSADRPLTDSEVSFLRYIRQWGKKVVFVLNKVDTLDEDAGELDEVLAFVRSNVQRLLGVGDVLCFPVSSRLALSAKMAWSDDDDNVTPSVVLASSESWKASRFGELESFIRGFLDGSSDAGVERMRLKLDTPIGVGAALMAAAERQLAAEKAAADADLAALQAVGPQMAQYKKAMLDDSTIQQARIAGLVDEALERAEAFVDSTLRAGNLDGLLQYALAPPVSPDSPLPILKSFQSRVIGSAAVDAKRALYEHHEWLLSNNTRQFRSYCEFATARWPSFANACLIDVAREQEEAERRKEEARAAGIVKTGEEGEDELVDLATVTTLEGFDTTAAAILLEEEIRQAVRDTFSGFGVAGSSAVVLTSILPNSLEDLLALALCTAGGSLGVINLPAKREAIKKKVRRAAGGLVKTLRKKLEEELEEGVKDLETRVEEMFSPYRAAVDAELERVTGLQSRLYDTARRIDKLRQRVRNLGA